MRRYIIGRALTIPVVLLGTFGVMAAVGFLKVNPSPTREQLAHGISGNLCRCQDYDKILTSLMRGGEYLAGRRS